MMRLENLSGEKYVLVLCCHTELKNTIFEEIKLLSNGDTGNVGQWKSRVNSHLMSILENRLPSLLRSKIPKYLVSLVSLQITKWAIFHEENFGLPYLFSRDFIKASHLTERYTIDRERAAIELVTDTSLDILVRFKVACFYLLTDEIDELWDELSCSQKILVRKDKNEMVHLMSNYTYLSTQFNNFRLTYGKYRSERFYTDVFETAVKCGSEAAAMQSWNKERKDFPKIAMKNLANKFHGFSYSIPGDIIYSPEIFLPFEPYVELLIFLYDKLGIDDFWDLLNRYDSSSFILYYLLHWPYQDMFLSIVDIMWVFIDVDCFYNLLHIVIYKMKDELVCLSYDYKSLFREFWINSPLEHKRFVCRREGVYVYDLDDYDDDDDDDSNGDTYRDESQRKKLNQYLIFNYFTLNDLTSYDEETLQLMFSGWTVEEKERIVTCQGVPICQELIKAGNFKLADLFVNYCMPNQRCSTNFKANLLTPSNFNYIFWDLVSKNEVKLAEVIFNWALPSEEVESVKQNLLEVFSLRNVLRHFRMKPSRKEGMDNFLRWILAPDEVVEFKRNLMSNINEFALLFASSIFDGNFQPIDSFLQWIYKSEYEMNTFKTDLAFTVISDPCIVYVKQSLDFVDHFIEWSIVDEIKRKEFRFQLAFVSPTFYSYSLFIVHRIPFVIDEFISWCQISKDDAREFKKKLMFYEENTFVEYSHLVVNGKHEEVDNFLEWSELSGKDLKNFRRRIRKCCENNIFIDTYILEDKSRKEISNVFSWIKSSEEELKEFVKKVMASLRSLRNKFGVIFENGQQKDIEELLMECQWSEEEIKDYKKLFLINKNSASFLQKLVSDKKWVDITDILSWIGLSHEEMPIFKRELFDISKTICFQLAIRGKYDDVNVYLTWLEISPIEMNSYVKEMRNRAKKFYRLITKNLGKNNILVQRYLRRKMRYGYQFREFGLAFFAWVNLYWGNGLCLYCEKNGNFVSVKIIKHCKHCRMKRPSHREVSEMDKLIDQLSRC